MAKLQLMMGQQISQTTGLKSIGMDFEEETRRKLEEEQFMAESAAKMQQRMELMAQMDQMAVPEGAMGGMPGGMPGGGMPGGGMPGGGMGGSVMPPAGAAPPPAGAAPPPAGGGGPMDQAAGQFAAQQPLLPNQPITPEEMMGRANEVAQQLMTLPETQRKSELINLKRTDPTLHSLVISIMDDIRQQARSQGQQMVLQQQYGGGQAMPPGGAM